MSEPEADDVSPIMGVDRLIHEPARFSILAHLYVVEEADFLFLSHRIGLPRGNLSAHMRKLEQGGFIEVRKEFMGRRPHTVLVITGKGQEAFKNYISNIQSAIQGFE